MKIILLLLFTVNAYAEGMNDCMKMTGNDKLYCLAKYSGSATFCDKMIGYEKRSECYRMVIRKQRESK